MRIDFFMPMKPPTATHQEKQVRVVNGKPVLYDPPSVLAARSKLTAHLAGHKPVRPLVGGVRLLVKWCFPRGRHEDGEYRTTRPDTDNLQKLLKDCMTAVGFWKDDAQVASEICEKFWAEVPGIYVCMETLEDYGLVVVYGYSDDNVEFRGAINEEIGAYEGTIVYITAAGLLEEPACDTAEDCTCPYFAAAKSVAKTIEAIWHDADGPCWTYKTDIPHETFDIYEDGEVWCVGIVFSVEDLT